MEASEAILGIIRGSAQSDVEILTGYIAIVEVMREDGSKGLRLFGSEDMTSWLAEGMLRSGIDMVREVGSDSEDWEEE